MPTLLLPLLLAVIPVPPLSGPVVDLAGIVDPASHQRLESLARAARAMNGGSGIQLQILTVPSLNDGAEAEPIEDFSIRVAEAWKIGSKGQDNGLLFTVAKAERKFRLEVGGGLEGDLTDIQAKRLLDDTLTPAFRRGDFGGGLYAASLAALNAVHGLPQGSGSVPQNVGWSQPPPRAHLGFGGIVLLILLALLFIRFPGFFLGMLLGGFGRSGGGGGGGWGGGGGGWSGGGGGFSGGGASGGW